MSADPWDRTDRIEAYGEIVLPEGMTPEEAHEIAMEAERARAEH